MPVRNYSYYFFSFSIILLYAVTIYHHFNTQRPLTGKNLILVRSSLHKRTKKKNRYRRYRVSVVYGSPVFSTQKKIFVFFTNLRHCRSTIVFGQPHNARRLVNHLLSILVYRHFVFDFPLSMSAFLLSVDIPRLDVVPSTLFRY